MLAIERATSHPGLCQALDRLYAACHLSSLAVLVAYEVDDFTRLVRIAGRPRGIGYWVAMLGFLTGYAVFVSLMASDHPPKRSASGGVVFIGVAVLMTLYRPTLISWPAYDALPARLVSVAAVAGTIGVGGLVALATGSGMWGGAAAMWTAVLSYGLLLFADATGGPSPWLRSRRRSGARLPWAGALPIREQLQPRLASAIAAAMAQHGRAADGAPPAERIDRAITAAFDRAWMLLIPQRYT